MGRRSRAIPGLLIALLAASVLAGAVPERAARGAERPPLLPADLGRRPIDITADRLSAEGANDTVLFEGNVVARQADVTMHADRLTAFYSRASRAVERIEAEGNVRILHAGREARGPKAVFHNLEQRIVMSGGAELVSGENTLRGESVTIYLRENRSVVTGGDGGRVRGLIHPRGAPESTGKTDKGEGETSEP